GLDGAETAVLGLLFLRGPQTGAELKARSERLHHFASNDEVAETLQRLETRELARLSPRRPGQREERWTHLLAEDAREGPQTPGEAEASHVPLEQRLARIEDRLTALEHALADRDDLV